MLRDILFVHTGKVETTRPGPTRVGAAQKKRRARPAPFVTRVSCAWWIIGTGTKALRQTIVIGFVLRSVSVVVAQKFVATIFARVRSELQCRSAVDLTPLRFLQEIIDELSRLQNEVD